SAGAAGRLDNLCDRIRPGVGNNPHRQENRTNVNSGPLNRLGVAPPSPAFYHRDLFIADGAEVVSRGSARAASGLGPRPSLSEAAMRQNPFTRRRPVVLPS